MKKYIAKLSLAFSFVLASVFCFNYEVDPYNLFGNDFFGLSEWKTENVSNIVQSTPLAVSANRPSLLFLGNSRIDYGFDPNHSALSDVKAYNAAYSGQRLSESFSLMRHAYEEHGVTRFLIGVDSISEAEGRETHDDYVCMSDSYFCSTRNLFTFNVSYMALGLSIETLINQAPTRYHNLENGMRDPARNEYYVERAGGYYHSFDKYERHRLSRGVQEPSSLDVTCTYCELIINYAYQNNLNVDFVFPPMHVRQLVHRSLVDANAVAEWEESRRVVREINEKVSEKFRSSPFPIWDFSGFNAFTTEPVPSVDEEEKIMTWHWESSHFKSELGDKVIERIFIEENEWFGVRLDQMTETELEVYFMEQSRLSSEWTKNNYDVVEQMKQHLP